MKQIILLSLLFFAIIVNAQPRQKEYSKAVSYLNKKGEVYFRFTIHSKSELEKLTRLISIDNVKGRNVFAYANKKEFEVFHALDYNYSVLKHPGDMLKPPKMYEFSESISYDFQSYPTYDAYVSLLFQFEANFPGLCRIYQIGTTTAGRKLFFAKISDNVNTQESEPRFMYTSTMHGDETAGYVLMLRLINYLLENYNTDSQVTNLVDNLEIWINPLANPDGTYAGGNSTVNGANRFNATGVDLNRNFPNPVAGPHPDGNDWQNETLAFEGLADTYQFVMSANFHGGTEVVNYPWDTWAERHPEDSWFQYVSHIYADLAQENSPSGYMDGFNDGITNGYDWYQVFGSRQDFMDYYYNCREVTIELSNTKLLPESELNNHWNYNYRSLLAYMEEALSICPENLSLQNTTASVFNVLEYHTSNTITAAGNATYFIIQGSGTNGGDVRFSAGNIVSLQDGFHAQPGSYFHAYIQGCTATEGLKSLPVTANNLYDNEENIPENLSADNGVRLYPNPTSGEFLVEISGNTDEVISIEVINLMGQVVYRNEYIQGCTVTIDISAQVPGAYFVRTIVGEKVYIDKILKQ